MVLTASAISFLSLYRHDTVHTIVLLTKCNVAGPLHFGGDEVWVQCWDASPEVGQWLQVNNLSSQEAIFELMNVTHSVAAAAGRSVLHYQEVGHPAGDLSAGGPLPWVVGFGN